MALKNIYNILVDLKIVRSINQPLVTQNDSVVFILEVMDNGVPFDLTDTTTMSLAHTRRDGTVVVTPGTKEGNIATFELGTNETAVAGGVIAKAQFYDAEGRVSTLSFGYTVGVDPTGSGYVPSETEQTLIQVVMADAQAKIDELSAVDVVVLNQQLAEKADLTDVRLNAVKIGQTDVTEEFLQQMAGTTPINAIPADYSLTEKKFAIPVVVGKQGKNLFDKNSAMDGFYIDVASGNKFALTGWSAVENIPVTGGLTLVNNHTDHQGAFEDSNGVYISGFDSTVNPIPIPINAVALNISFANVRLNTMQLEYGTVSTEYEAYGTKLDAETVGKGTITEDMLAFQVEAKNEHIITVKTSGGDFTNPSTAIASITDASETNKYIVEVYEGDYDIFGNLTVAQYGKGITLPNYVDVIGVGSKENIILRGEHSLSATQTEVEQRSTLNIDHTNGLKNLTVLAKNCRYAVHADNSNTSKDYVWDIENCDFIHEGNDPSFTWQNIIAWGSGLASGAKETFKNCRFKGNAGYTCHNNPNFTKDTLQVFDNCTFEGQLGGNCIQFISMDSNVKSKVVMVGCTYNGSIALTNTGVNPFEFEVEGYSNTKTPHSLAQGTFINFKDELFSSVANKPIAKGLPVKSYYNQCEPMELSVNGNGKSNFYAGICMKDCVANETCYIKYSGFIDLTGIVAGASVGNYIGIVNGVLGVVADYNNAIGIIVNGNTMKFY